MKKIFLAILLSIGIALGGCATTGPGGGTKSTIPSMEYDDLDFFNNGNIIKVPKYIKARSIEWISSSSMITETIQAITFHNRYDFNKKATWVLNLTYEKVLLLVYTDGKTILDFYIYDGKQFPTKTTKESVKAYMKLITSRGV